MIVSRTGQFRAHLLDTAALVMDPSFDPRFEAVRQDLYEMMGRRRLTNPYARGAQLSCRPLSATPDRSYTLTFSEQVEDRSLESLALVLTKPVACRPQVVHYQPPYLPMKDTDCRELGAVLVDWEERRCYLLAFATNCSDIESNWDRLARIEMVPTIAATGNEYSKSLQFIAVTVVPPWLAEEIKARLKTVNPDGAVSSKLPRYIAPLDVSRWQFHSLFISYKNIVRKGITRLYDLAGCPCRPEPSGQATAHESRELT